MICYQDRALCSASGVTCANTDCYRYLSDKVQEDARKWWGRDGAPIAVIDLSEGCQRIVPIEAEA